MGRERQCSVNTYSGVTSQSWVSHVGHRFFFVGGKKGPIYINNTYPKIARSYMQHVKLQLQNPTYTPATVTTSLFVELQLFFLRCGR